MSDCLTKDARYAIKAIYDTYQKRRKSGMSKSNAAHFWIFDDVGCTKLSVVDFRDTLGELKRAEFIEAFYADYNLTEKGISYMENIHRNKPESILNWLETGASVIGALSGCGIGSVASTLIDKLSDK